MSLQKGRFSEIPADAVILSEQEALKYQTKMMNNWKTPSDIFGYKYGAFFLGGASFLTGSFFNSYYRQKFKLLHYGRASTYLAAAFLPAAFSAALHAEFVLKDVVLQKYKCPICLEIRGAATQALVGVGFPLLLSPVANLSMVHKYGTQNLPDVVSETKELFKFLRVKSLGLVNIALALCVVQAVVGSTVTYLENKSVLNVHAKLESLEKQILNG